MQTANSYINRSIFLLQRSAAKLTFALQMLLLFFLVLIAAIHPSVIADESFDVRLHLSTVSRYGAVKYTLDDSFVPSAIRDGCKPIHLNLLARHGTRSPTKKRMRELERLGASLQMLLENAEKNNLSTERIPAWFYQWRSPWEGKTKGGELIIKGEEELYGLALRVRENFADLFRDEYHPDVYSMKATQVPRASASAVAFGMGLFKNNGTLGEERYRAFAISTESRASDILLRFYDTCQNYKEYRKSQEPAVGILKDPVFNEIAESLSGKYGLNLTGQHVSSLWYLCKQEASLLDITRQACRLFTPAEVELLEWTDDIELFVLKGYGNSLNYDMGVPLLNDVFESMESAIKANEEAQTSGSYEKARLRFAHAETLVPFSCLLGLFLEGPDFEKIQRKEPLQLPPKPPQKRTWKGSIVAPFAGNHMLVLYNCPASSTSSKYFVRSLHNEHPIPIPGCNNSDFCPFEVFKEKVVMPNLKNDYDSVCNAKFANPETEAEPSKSSILYSWLPSTGKNDINSGKNEL